MIVSVRFSVCFADINHFDGALIISRTTYALFPLPPPIKYRREDLQVLQEVSRLFGQFFWK